MNSTTETEGVPRSCSNVGMEMARINNVKELTGFRAAMAAVQLRDIDIHGWVNRFRFGVKIGRGLMINGN